MNKNFYKGFDFVSVIICQKTKGMCIKNEENKLVDVDLILSIKEHCENILANKDEYIIFQEQVSSSVDLKNKNECELIASKERSNVNTKSNGYVYLISDIDNNTYKIGYSKNPKGRLKQLQIATSNKLILLHTINCNSGYTEEFIHDKFKDLKIKSEWFTKDSLILDFFIKNQTEKL